VEWFDQDRKLASVGGDFRACIYDTNTMKMINTLFGHSGSLRSIDNHSSSPDIYITAARDGEILLYDVRVKSLIHDAE